MTEPSGTVDVVAAASDPANPLHDRFEWDDAVAAAKYREAVSE